MKLVFILIVGALFSIDATAVNTPMWSKVSRSSKWDATIERSLLGENKDLLDAVPKDAKKFCPNFDNLKQDERIDFWLQLISALAEKESSFRSHLSYREGFRDKYGNRVVSRGLLQLSKFSSRLYGCPIRSDSDLHDPETNLLCGLKIMKRWIQHDKVIAGGGPGAWRGLARYWGPFRTKKLASIRANVRSASFCQN